MYKLYTDKSEDFKCKIGVEGTNLNETFARLVIESEDVNLLFEGKIDKEGNCVVPIKKLRNLIPEGNTGKMKLEVIAEDTFFSPWEDEYEVDASKKVTVEVEQKEKEPIKENRIKVNVVTPTPQPKDNIVETKKQASKSVNHGQVISKILSEQGVTLSNIKENKTKIIKTIKEYSTKHSLKTNTSTLLDEIINNLQI